MGRFTAKGLFSRADRDLANRCLQPLGHVTPVFLLGFSDQRPGSLQAVYTCLPRRVPVDTGRPPRGQGRDRRTGPRR